MLDAATGQPAGDLVARRVGDSLVVEQAGGATVELTEFFAQCAPGEGCELVLEDGEKTTTISQATEPMSVAADGSQVMYDGSMAAQAGAAPAKEGAAAAADSAAPAAGDGAAAATPNTGAIIAGVGGLGLVAAAGGGGGGGSDGTPADTDPPAAPVIDAIAGDNAIDATEAAADVVVSGTAEANSTVTVTWGVEGQSKTATAGADGAWSVSFAPGELPEGAVTISATATDAAGNTSQAASASVTVEAAAPGDTTPPAAPVINAVTGDNAIDATEAANGFSVTGTAEAGSTITLTVAGTAISKTATVDGAGAWSVDIAAAEVPADGSHTFSATATDAAGNVSAAGTASVTIDSTAVDTDPPDAPVITEVGTAGVANAAAVAAGVAVSGTAEPGSTVDVTWGALSVQAVAGGDGIWTASFAANTTDPATQITATATDAAGNTSPASAPGAITVDVTPPAAPTIDAVATDNIVDPLEAGAGVEISGTGEEGSEITVDWGGVTKTTTVASGTWTVSYATGEVPAAGSTTVSVTAVDVAGNPQAGPAVTQSVTVTDVMPSNQVVGGAGNQTIVGTDGNDVLVGDSAGSVRNYQFDYWNMQPDDMDWGSPDGTASDRSYAGIKPGVTFGGWTVGNAELVDGVGGGSTGGHAELHGTQDYPDGGYHDETGAGGTHYFETVYAGGDGASSVRQSVMTSAGETYNLAIQLSTFNNGTSFEVVWNGEVIAYYDGTPTPDGDPAQGASISDPANWTGPATATMTFTAAGGDGLGIQTVANITVTATGESSAIELRGYDTVGGDGEGLLVHRVTLTAHAAAGDDVLDGGAGNDLIFGQGGNDTLTGGAGADTFVFSMHADNGNDVITDFEVGVDRIMLIDSIDATHVANPAGSPGPFENPSSDGNLTFADFMVAGTQQITLSANGDGDLVLGFGGELGSNLGSVTLTGVAAAGYGSVQSLFDAGILVATGDGFHAGLTI
ncbi:MAG: Ig-like domain-containing protein [Burkholderiaceae bacterium]|nr:Ig-like domain-containing protein [Burkholderiaceae bacterium]